MKLISQILNIIEAILCIVGILLTIYFLYYLVVVFFPLIAKGVA